MPELTNIEMWNIDRQRYMAFCERFSAQMPLFFHSWWLDAVCGPDSWRPIIQDSGACIWPVYMKRKFFIHYATQPPFTPLLGCWAPDQPITAPEITHWLQQCWPLPYLVQHQAGTPADNLVFHSANFTLTPYLQYLIPPEIKADQLFRNFNENARRNIRKANQQLTITEETDTAILHQLVTMSYQRHHIPFTTSKETLQSIYQALSERKQGVIWTAKDTQNRIHAVILLAWDPHTMYYLAGGLDHHIPQVGASRWLLWNAICTSREMGLAFNFGGGLTPSIDAIYQSMNGQPVPWVRMTYASSPFLGKSIQWLKNWLHRSEKL